jgi:diguanylate cyclase (GGDEF)-like protein/PAS domain S-box-containing protein
MPALGPVTVDALDAIFAVARFDGGGGLISANARFYEMFGLSRAGSRSFEHRLLCPDPAPDGSGHEALWRQLTGGRTFTGRCERRGGDGSALWVEATYTPLTDEDGETESVAMVAVDVAERGDRHRTMGERNRLLAMAADAADAAIMLTDGNGLIFHVNAGFTRLLGWTPVEVIGRHPAALMVPERQSDTRQTFHEALKRGEVVRREEIVTGRDDQRIWMSITTQPILGSGGDLVRSVSLMTDITRPKLREVLQHNVLEVLAGDPPLVTVLDRVCREVERIAPEVRCSILAVDEQRCLKTLVAPNLPRGYCEAIDGMAIGPFAGSCGTAAWRDEAVIVTDIASDPLWADYRDLILPYGFRACWSKPIHAPDGSVIGTFALYFRRKTLPTALHHEMLDACGRLCGLVMEREQARGKIRLLASYDSLTGLPNRALLAERASGLIARDSARPLAVLSIDLDRFRHVNDLHGHAIGDAMLRDIGLRLRAELRGDDVASRFSGDEFVAVLAGVEATQVSERVERFLKRLARDDGVGEARISASASVGIALYPGDGGDIETLIRRADMAMNEAKASGPGQFRFFSSEMNKMARERHLLESALRAALADGGLQLQYQPQVDLDSGALAGAEALARWTHPSLGPISPGRFVPLAEECGLIEDLGRWALAEACRQLARWRAEGLAVPNVSVNLSPTSFHDRALPRFIVETLAAAGLAPTDLTVEITESVLLDTHPSTFETIGAVHALGIRLSLDDFGTGYSSLGYLLRLPISEIKLDRSFVAEIETEVAARSLSEAVIRIGDSLGLKVVAEGVETGPQQLLLAGQGYRIAQGYLFARPMTPGDFAAWLARPAS